MKQGRREEKAAEQVVDWKPLELDIPGQTPCTFEQVLARRSGRSRRLSTSRK